MQPSPRMDTSAPIEFSDGLGVRSVIAEKNGEVLELLRIVPEIGLVPAFEAALRERVGRLANFRHGYYARMRRVEKLEGGVGLGLVSERPAGTRLAQVLAGAERFGLDLEINAALCLVRQLVPAVAMLHQNARDVGHGTIAPERLLVTSNARIVITDYVLGAAVEQLHLSRERLWRDLQVAVPPGAGHPRLDQRTDVMQIGMVALALILGRRLRRDDLRNVSNLVAGATETTILGKQEPISSPLRRWLLRMLQLDPRGAFESAAEAQTALDEVLAGEGGYVAAPIALETFLARYHECVSGAQDADEPPLVPEPPPVRSPQQRIGTIPRKSAPEGKALDQPPAVPEKPEIVPMADAVAPEPPATPRPSGATRAVQAQKPTATPAASPAPGRSAVAPSPGVQPPSRVPDAAVAAPVVPAETVLPPSVAVVAPPPPPAPDAAPQAAAAAAPGPSLFGLRGRSPDARTEAEPAPQVSGPATSRWRRAEHIALAVCFVAAVGQAVFIWSRHVSAVVFPKGTLSVDTRPAGVQVVVDGAARGVTPLKLELPEGAHVLELRAGGEPRVLPVTITAGGVHAQYVEMRNAVVTGSLLVRSQPSGARVLVDGHFRGVTPVAVADLSAGAHELVIESRSGQLRQTVQVVPGATATIDVPLSSRGSVSTASADVGTAGGGPGVGSGTVTVKAPYEMQVYEGGRLLGTTSIEAFPLPPGRHELEIVSETLAFRTRQVVDVQPGRRSAVTVQLPTGTLHLTSEPSADVYLDGTRIGQTPLSVPVPIGPHEVAFRHPDFAEQVHAVSVTAQSPARLDVRLSR